MTCPYKKTMKQALNICAHSLPEIQKRAVCITVFSAVSLETDTNQLESVYMVTD